MFHLEVNETAKKVTQCKKFECLVEKVAHKVFTSRGKSKNGAMLLLKYGSNSCILKQTAALVLFCFPIRRDNALKRLLICHQLTDTHTIH